MSVRSWLRGAVILLLLLAAAGAGFSRLLQTRRAHRFLAAKLEAAFGRPVEVGQFDYSLLAGPRLEARSVTVAEDPAFGAEYFLRAESLSAGLRWSCLLQGRLELGTLAFSRPSLNLVRLADGRWNVERWLPPARGAARPPAAADGRLHRIEVDEGRINFKRGVDKHPFALVDLQGSIEQEAAGRWRLDLEARPVRAGVALQQAGTLRARGHIAGTSARLQPAEIQLTWREASLADVLRLARAQDYGVRGDFSAELTARSAAPETPDATGARWRFTLAARASSIHRWDLTERPDDPAASLRAEAGWATESGRVEMTSLLLEGPHSQLRGAGTLDWTSSLRPKFAVASPGIGLTDVLAWYRAFHPDVAEGLSLEGTLRAKAEIGGLPWRLESAEMAAGGATLRVPGIEGPVRIERVSGGLRAGWFEWKPARILFPATPEHPASGTPQKNAAPASKVRPAAPSEPGDTLSLEGRISADARRVEWHLQGAAGRAEDLLAFAGAAGRPLNRGWKLAGNVGVNLRGTRERAGERAEMSGTVDLRGAELRVAGLNLPAEIRAMRLEWRGEGLRASLTDMRALGAAWSGSVSRTYAALAEKSGVWQFDLKADRLDAAELNAWLGPRARPGFLERLFPGPAAGAQQAGAASLRDYWKNIRAEGRLAVREFFLAPFRLRRLNAAVKLEGLDLRLENVDAEFAGGAVRGAFEASFAAEPKYRVDAKLERIHLAQVAASLAALKDRFAGTASGDVHLTTRGLGRENLQQALEGRGGLRIDQPEFRGLDLAASLADGVRRTGNTRGRDAEAAFSIGLQKVSVERLEIRDARSNIHVEGSVDFRHRIDLRVAPAGQRGLREDPKRHPALHLTGTLEAPAALLLEPKPGAR